MVCGNGYEVSECSRALQIHSSVGKNKTCLLSLMVVNQFTRLFYLWG